LWLGTGLSRIDCDPAGVADGATLSIPGSDPPAPVPFPRSALALAPGRAGEAGDEAVVAVNPQEALARAAAAEEEAAWEMGWRQAFREANDRVAQARQRRLDIQAQREEARDNYQIVLEQQLDAELEIARLEEKRAEEALGELDRRASLAAVPRLWRRAE
jgi:multidrug efflux pump subunit AcrA (membrane-fusion protein)